MEKNVAIKVNNVSKVFRVPHKKIDSVRTAFVNFFSRNSYEEFHALKDISFEVKKGEFLGIIGHNGAGKSTLLKTLAGVYEKDSGTIEIDGRISPFLELGIGFNPELSGRDNVYLNATVLGVSKKEIDEKFDEIVKFAELEKFIDQQIKNYSSGMRARLAFSVSIHANREILLMDEVLAVGDGNFQQKCLDIFEGYKDQGKTVVLVTHSMSTVREYCDRALLFHKGELIEVGDVDEVCDEYILKNMTDEEREELEKREKIEEKEKERVEELKNESEKEVVDENKKQFIKSVVARDLNEKILKRTTRGETFYVDVIVQLEEVLEDLFISVQIFEENKDCFVSGNNTFRDNYECRWEKGENTIRLIFTNHNLNVGNIYFCVYLSQKKDVENVMIDAISSLDFQKSIEVYNDKKSGAGVICMEHKWERIN